MSCYWASLSLKFCIRQNNLNVLVYATWLQPSKATIETLGHSNAHEHRLTSGASSHSTSARSATKDLTWPRTSSRRHDDSSTLHAAVSLDMGFDYALVFVCALNQQWKR